VGVSAVVSVMALAVVAPVTSSQASDAPILIGLIAGTTGAYGSTGINTVQGAELAVAVINKDGGLLGRKVALAWYDDNASATVAATLFKKLDSAGAVAIVGSPDTGPATAALAARYKLPDVGIVDDGGPTIYTQGINGPPNAWAWGYSINNFAIGALTAKYTLNHCPGGKFALVHDTTTYGEGMSQSVEQAYKAAGKSAALTVNDGITENWATAAVVDVQNEITKIKATGASCVDVWLTPQDTAAFLQEASTLGDRFTVFSNDEVYATSTFVQLAGKLANGVITAEQVTGLKPNAATKLFTQQFNAKFHPAPGYNTTYAQGTYDSIMMVAKAIKTAGSTRATAIQSGLNHMTNYLGATGVITFTPMQHQSMTAKTLTLVKYDGTTKTWNQLNS
jgi:ABC-type branched-subunit amino acid transport system substrate-binding protein